MGWSNHTAFVASADVPGVAAALGALFAREGRAPAPGPLDGGDLWGALVFAGAPIKRPDSLPARRSPRWDLGFSREVKDGGRVGPEAYIRTSRPCEGGLTQSAREMTAPFAGGPGWSVIKSAPASLLAEPSRRGTPRIAELCRELGVEGFAYCAFDGGSHVMIEADAAGRAQVTGFYGPSPGRFHGGADALDPATMTLRFELLSTAVRAAAGRDAGEIRGVATGALPTAGAIAEVLERRRAALSSWVTGAGGQTEERPVCGRPHTLWRAPAASIVRGLASASPPPVGVEATGRALLQVFGGDAAPTCEDDLARDALSSGRLDDLPSAVARYYRRA